MGKIQKILAQQKVATLFQEMRLGIEKESQRVTLEGVLARTDHPQVLGNRSYHPYIQTDFSENQMELITPITRSEKEALKYLAAFHDVSLRSMNSDEMLWPMSMPPALPDCDEEIRIAKLDKFEEVLYRRYLAKAYGKRKQMVSGIHYNFEFAPEFVEEFFKQQTEFDTLDDLRTYIYLKVATNYLRYRWLITYLFGASPVSETGYFTTDEYPEEPVRSIRNSSYGYTNDKNVEVSYASIEEYVQGIHDLVEKGILSEEKEFYAPVRLRGGKRVADLKEYGVNYIEVRNIDLNPYAQYGIEEETLHFLHLFLRLMLWLDNDDVDTNQEIALGGKINNQVALEHPLEKTAYYDEGQWLFGQLKQMLVEQNSDEEDLLLVEKMQNLLDHPEETFSGRMVSSYQTGEDNHLLAVHLGREYYEKAWAKPYQLTGFENMELSTQILMFDAIQKGISVEVLDENDQFLKLSFKKHVEYVKNANMTSKDSYIVPLIMENKTVTKKVLASAGYPVPQGREYQNLASAMHDYVYFEGKGIVIKPKSTNYGLGISIFKDGASREDYETALAIAFAEDSDVLIEEFLAGTEYRFFVLNGKTEAIMLRVPANVVGDGAMSVAELVAEKNLDPLRGTDHRAPLELIQLGEIEKLMLKEQNLTPESIPAKDQVVYLRENSNISTGGDSIDMTDDFIESYKTIAEEAVTAIGATICGIDLIIPDREEPASIKKRNFGIIEANFNPAMHMHTYPFSGKGRRLTKKVLTLLFPEVP